MHLFNQESFSCVLPRAGWKEGSGSRQGKEDQTISRDILILHELSSQPVFIKKELMCTVQS